MKWLTVVTVSIVAMASQAAMANCTPEDNARLNAIGAQQKNLEAKMRAGNCSVHPDYIRISHAAIAILSDSARRPGCWVKWKKRSASWPGCVGTMTRAEAARAKTQTSASAKEPTPARSSDAKSKSGSCSDITGTGSGDAPRNCGQTSDTPSTVQTYTAQAQSYSQAAQTVKQSDLTPDGWKTAATLYRKAATAFQLAGNLAQAQAATDQAQTLENGLKMASQSAAQPRNAPNPTPSDPAPAAVANAAPQSSTSFNIPTPCQDLTGKYGCKTEGAIALSQQPKLSEGENQRLNKPRPWTPGGLAPDVNLEIAALAENILAKSDDAVDRSKLVRALERRLADHRVPVKQKDIACLQPVSGVDHRLLDVPLRWHPHDIEKEAIDRSHLCDGVADGAAKQNCRESKYGQAVMWAEPELAGQCRSAGGADHDVEAVAECARRKFLNAWANSDGIVPAPLPNTWIMPAMCSAAVPPTQIKQTLRDRLRAALAAAAMGRGDDSGDDSPALGASVSDSSPSSASSPPPMPPAVDDDEAYCNYMARNVVRGELTPSGSTEIPSNCKATIAAASMLKAEQQANGVQPFSINADDTDKEIRRLLQQPVAKSQVK